MRSPCALFWLQLLVLVVLINVPQRAHAMPWAELTDRQLKQDAELLHAFDLIDGPLLSWPLSYTQLAGLSRQPRTTLPSYVARARGRVLEKARFARKARLQTELSAHTASKPALVRDFGENARQTLDTSLALSVQGKGGFARLGPTYRAPQPGRDFLLDRTLLGYSLGSVDVYAGYAELWWGPSNEGNLLLSNSARTFPKLGFRRMDTSPFKSRWLSWLGPYRLEAFVGVLDERRDADNALIVGMRAEIEPVRRWSLGFTRVLQLCGEGRPCGAGTWGKALIGVGDVDNTGTANEPGNQLAAIDTRYSLSVRQLALAVYAQALAEDEGSYTIYRFAQLWGTTVTGPLGDHGAMWVLGAEYTDTRARNYLFAGERRPGVIYRHHIYTDGYSYGKRPIGFSLDGDARLLSLTFSVTDARNHRFFGAARGGDLNHYALPRYHISDTRELFGLFELGAERTLSFGMLRCEARLEINAPNTPLSSPVSGQIEAGYRLTF